MDFREHLGAEVGTEGLANMIMVEDVVVSGGILSEGQWRNTLR